MNNQIYKFVIEIVQDLENTREDIHGYPYVRTIRNILIGKEDAIIAPNFKNKQYYGLVNELTLQETEKILDYLVVTNQITYFPMTYMKITVKLRSTAMIKEPHII